MTTERAIRRMNFMEAKPGAFTYRMMTIILISWVCFLMFLFVIQVVRELALKHDISKMNEAVVQLDKEKDVHLNQIQRAGQRRFGVAAKEGLTNILQNRPRWSVVLGNLTKNLPAHVWLESVVVKRSEDAYKMEIFGRAKSQAAITNFIIKLESSGMFSDTALQSSRKSDSEDGFLEYDITTKPVVVGF